MTLQSVLNRRLAGFLVINMLLLVIAPPTWAQGANTQVLQRHRATITEVKGTVEVKSAGTTAWVRAAANREVKAGDRIRTQAASGAKIKVGDVGQFDVGASTELTVGNLQQVKTNARAFFMFQRVITRDDVGMDLKSGDMRSGFQRREGRVGNYNVYTPVAVAGVRGTQFELDLDGGKPWYEQMADGKGQGEEQALTAAVLEGEVGLIGPNWERSITAGQQLTAVSGKTPGQPTAADPNRLRGIGEAVAPPKDEKAPVFEGAKSATRTTNSIQLTWSAANDDSTTVENIIYDIYAAIASQRQDFSAPTATTAKGATQFTLTGLDEAKGYYVVVRARDEVGNRDNNTKELIVKTGDATAPEFGGVTTGSWADGVKWSAGSDNATASDKIVYEIYVSTMSGGQDFTKPIATAATGATSYVPTGLSDQSKHYVVVRALDEAGNRDANTKEVVLVPPALITQELKNLTTQLFERFAAKDLEGFLKLVRPTFVGKNSLGNVLSYGPKLTEALSLDFTKFTSIEFTPVMTSVTSLGGDLYSVKVNWDARVRFQGSTVEYSLPRRSAEFVWEAKAPLGLSSWADGVPFGFSNPDNRVTAVPPADNTTTSTEKLMTAINDAGAGDVVVSDVQTSDGTTASAPITITPTGPAIPTLVSLEGQTSFPITGDYRDFAPISFKVNGSGFQSGARVEHYEDHTGVAGGIVGWRDVTVGTSHSGTVFFNSSSQLEVSFSKFIEMYYPEDALGANERFRVVNPDGQISNEITQFFSFTPGLLNAVGVSSDRPINIGDRGPYSVFVKGYNFVTPVAVRILNLDGTPNPKFTVTAPNIYGSDAPNPLTAQFSLGHDGSISPGSYLVELTDGRGQKCTIGFGVESATEIRWTTNQSLSSDFIVNPGQTLYVDPGVTVMGNGFKIQVNGTIIANNATFNGAQVLITSGANSFNGTTHQNITGAAVALFGGSATFGGGSFSNVDFGILTDVGAGNITVDGMTISANQAGLKILMGSATLRNVSSTGSNTGLHYASSGPVTIDGGTYTGSNGIIAGGTGGLSIGSPGAVTINATASDGIQVMGGSVNMTGGFIRNTGSALTGVNLTASGGNVTLNGVTIQLFSQHGMMVSGGLAMLSGGNTVNGGSNAGVMVMGGTLQTSGVNTINGNGGIAGVGMSSGSAELSTGTTVSNAQKGVNLSGGFFTLSGATINTQSGGIGIRIDGPTSWSSSSGRILGGGAGQYGIQIDANTNVLPIANIDIENHSSWAIFRNGPTGTAGANMTNCAFRNNAGQGGSDLNTYPPAQPTRQYDLLHANDSVSSPRS